MDIIQKTLGNILGGQQYRHRCGGKVKIGDKINPRNESFDVEAPDKSTGLKGIMPNIGIVKKVTKHTMDIEWQYPNKRKIYESGIPK